MREESNRAEALKNDKRAGTIGSRSPSCNGVSHRDPRRSTSR
jgi:hypothetical protein